MILNRIVADSRLELESRKRNLPLAALRQRALAQEPPLDLAAALSGNGLKLIAEVKKASPSRGVICPDFDPLAIARTYANNGAAAISVLTETNHFQGSLNYLTQIKDTLGKAKLPLLRKDFIYEPYQIYESRACGADSLLLIVAILTPYQLEELLGLSHELKMHCLVEVHSEAELDIALNSRAKIIGINNRNLKTFNVDIATTEYLCSHIPAGITIISESGLKTRDDMNKLRQWGIHAALIGEALMAAPDIAAKMRELL